MRRSHRVSLRIAGVGVVLGLVILIAVAALDSSSADHEPGFVYRSGASLMLDGSPYRFVGLNAYGMVGCETGSAWTDAQLDTYFANLPPAAMTRTWAFQPSGTADLDRVVASAQRHGQKLVLVLGNGTNDCDEQTGAVGQPGDGRTAAWYQSGYRANYLPWVRTTVARYQNSSAVAIWEILNEAGYLSNVTFDDLKTMIDTAARTIKAADPHHLVGTGSLAPFVYGGTDNYRRLHADNNIDVGSLHEYDYDNAQQIVSDQFPGALAAMNSLDKPLIIGEFGVQAGNGCPTDPTTRADVIRQKYDAYLSAGAQGVLYWTRGIQDSYTGCVYDLPPSDPAIAMIKRYEPPR
jgi:mannan endo-1,4-beta-mannosidase